MTIRTPKPKFRKPATPTKDQLVKEIAGLKAGTVDQASKIYEYMQANVTLLGRVEQYQEIIKARDYALETMSRRDRDLYRDVIRITEQRDEAVDGRDFLLRVAKRLSLETVDTREHADDVAAHFWKLADQLVLAERPLYRKAWDWLKDWIY